MAELEEKLNAILSDPKAMGQIMSIAKALTGEGDAAPAQTPPPPEDTPQADTARREAEVSNTQPDWSALLGGMGGDGGAENPLSALSGLDPQFLQAAARLLAEYSATDDRKVALLAALKPFIKPERYAKVDKAIQLAKLSRVIRVAFQLFQERREEGAEDV